MSEVLRVALVGEGPTDLVVVEAALMSVLCGRSFVLRQLQPEGSIGFGTFGGGWAGVYRWCKQSARRTPDGSKLDPLLFTTYDLLVLHVDADVAAAAYGEGGIVAEGGDGTLPCARPCPPAEDSVDALHLVVSSWLGCSKLPGNVIACIPSMSTEAWVLALLFPADRALRSGASFECMAAPHVRLAQQPKARRIRKSVSDYSSRASDMRLRWPKLASAVYGSQARRFADDVLRAVAALADGSQ